MVENIRAGVQDRVERLGSSLEIRDQDLDAGRWLLPPDLPDRFRENFRATVGKVVAIAKSYVLVDTSRYLQVSAPPASA